MSAAIGTRLMSSDPCPPTALGTVAPGTQPERGAEGPRDPGRVLCLTAECGHGRHHCIQASDLLAVLSAAAHCLARVLVRAQLEVSSVGP